MAKIKEFTRTNLKSLREQITNALSKVGEKNGITLDIGNISFNADSFRVKLEAFIQSDSNSGMSLSQTKALADLKRYGFMFGLSEKDYGKTFKSNGKTFKLVGLAPKRTKYPIIAEGANGTEYIFPADVVDRLDK